MDFGYIRQLHLGITVLLCVMLSIKMFLLTVKLYSSSGSKITTSLLKTYGLCICLNSAEVFCQKSNLHYLKI